MQVLDLLSQTHYLGEFLVERYFSWSKRKNQSLPVAKGSCSLGTNGRRQTHSFLQQHLRIPPVYILGSPFISVLEKDCLMDLSLHKVRQSQAHWQKTVIGFPSPKHRIVLLIQAYLKQIYLRYLDTNSFADWKQGLCSIFNSGI